MKSLHPDHEINQQLCSCSRVFSSSASLQKHLSHCDGIAPLQCPNCKLLFNSKSAKSRHDKNLCEFMDLDTYHNNKGGRSGTTVTTAINPSSPVVDEPTMVMDFVDTNLQLVLEYILEKPEDIQVALADGYLNEYLTSITHFSGPIENRNVVKADLKSSTVKVWDKTRFVKTQLDAVLETILTNNAYLVKSCEIHNILATSCERATKLTPLQKTRELRSIRIVIEQDGAFVAIKRGKEDDENQIIPTITTEVTRRYKRVSIPQHVRNMVAAKQEWRCNGCDCLLSSVWHMDHDLALANGGDNDINNFQALCVECHTSKTAREAQLRSRDPDADLHRVVVPPPGSYYRKK